MPLYDYIHIICAIYRSSVVQPSLVVTETLQEATDWMGYVDPNEPRYCLCNQVRGKVYAINCVY